MSGIVIPNYLDVILEHHPNLVVKCVGTASEYNDLTVESGGNLPDKASLDALILAAKKVRMWTEIQEERTRRQGGGVFIQSANKWFHSDQSSRIQQLGLVMMGANMPQNINWKTMDSSYIVMTPSIALSIFNATATLDMTAFGVAEQHRVNMMQSSTPETYDYSGFWPAIFGG